MSEGRISENEALKYRRLAFYADDIERLNNLLSTGVKKSSAICILLIDKDGHLVAKQGFMQKIDSASLSALVAGSFASTAQVAKLLDEDGFDVLFHQGSSKSIHIRLVGERTLQVGVWPSDIKGGMIQVYTKELAASIGEVIEEIANRSEDDAPADAGLSEGFSDEMKSHLDNLFGDL